MRFGGLVAVDNLSFTAQDGEITALIGPKGRAKQRSSIASPDFTNRAKAASRFATATPRFGMSLVALTNSGKTQTCARAGSALYLLERLPDYLVAQQARVARTFQNIRLFPGMTVLENLLVAQHNTLMLAPAYTLLGVLGFPSYGRLPSVRPSTRRRTWLDRIGLRTRR